MPRAAMSVAINTGGRRDLKAARARSRWFCDLLPWMAAAVMPALSRSRWSLSAPCFVRVNTITRPVASSRSSCTSVARFSLLGTKKTDWLTVSAGVACGVVLTSSGSSSIDDASSRTSAGSVAENSSVWRSRGSIATIRFMSWMKPMSSIRSASSSTRNSTARRSTSRWPTRSSSRPGVAMTTSTPFIRAADCGRWLTPPKITAAVRPAWRP